MEREELIQELTNIGNDLYDKIGTDSYEIRCRIYDIRKVIESTPIPTKESVMQMLSDASVMNGASYEERSIPDYNYDNLADAILSLTPAVKEDNSDDMCFHECPNCNCRCNCSTQPCSCCDEAAVKESLTVERMTAEAWFDNNFDCYAFDEVLEEQFPAMTKEVFLEYASKPTVEVREVSEKCDHPYAYVYRKGDYERCTKCGKELCNG